ncbi:polysaccharide biosynthesis protein [Streptomyces genisteinicus]|uniref:Polysaccharide biosynthesis protein n=1 Tax=Streptomyces genisteinicus TaxID=2768068 RepID=A0A7H0I1E7_9ACTN|nr:polysaccharide biosynthesis protein [Streptomyces genisteinicus]QNP66613.1 polysaccharide biosynthesis protein [Streptomyces genisteinicus]
MSDDTIRLATIGRIVRRRGRLLAAFAVVGALVGYGTSLLLPPRYTTSASVLLPGAWEQRELLTQAEIAASSVVVDRAAAALDWSGTDGADLRDRVTARTADGNIVTISGTADTPERAQQLADQVARQFVSFAARIAGDGTDPGAVAPPEALRQLVVQTSRRITELAEDSTGQSVESVQTRTELAKLRTALQEAVRALDEADPAAGETDMVVMGPAVRPTGETPPTRLQLVAGGALLFFLLAVVGHLTAARMSRRLRTEAEIAAALGSASLGTVDVPAGPDGDRPAVTGRRARIRRLLGADVRWDVPPPQASGDEADRRVRCRRVHARLRERLRGPGDLLVVVPEGDGTALRAAGLLLAEAGGEDRRLRTVEVPVSGPLVPDRDDESGALVVLSAGLWTAEDLAGVAGACADAGHEVVGVVLAGAGWASPAGAAGPTGPVPASALAAGGETRGVSR